MNQTNNSEGQNKPSQPRRRFWKKRPNRQRDEQRGGEKPFFKKKQVISEDANGDLHMPDRHHDEQEVAVTKPTHLVTWDEIQEPKFAFKPNKRGKDRGVKVLPSIEDKNSPLRVIPVGGVEEVGGNSMIIEQGNDIVVIDCGALFGDPTQPGVDFVIPDLTYVQERKEKFRGFMITHGHYDHIGALRHILPKFDFPPVYGPKLAIGMLKRFLDEVGLLKYAKDKLHIYEPDQTVTMGRIKFEFFRVDHSIPDCVGTYIQTPVANIIHSGDFRIDSKEGEPQKITDCRKIAEFGRRGVDLLMSDSTGATIPGKAIPESKVIENMEEIVRNAKGKVVIATFSTLVERIQEIIRVGERTGRTVYLNGRSMLNMMTLAKELGIVKFREGQLKRVSKSIVSVPDDKIIIVTTGHQGEPLAGLTRMATGSHPHVKIDGGDTVIHSARIFPDKQGQLLSMINLLARKGAKILFKFNSSIPLHTSGHGYQDDLRYMLRLTKPKTFMPIHGEYFMRQAHGELAKEAIGMKHENIFMLDNGEILELKHGQVRKSKEKLELIDNIIESGFEGLITDPVIPERLLMRDGGVVVILMKINKGNRKLLSHPKIISKGFIFREKIQEVNKLLTTEVRKQYEKLLAKSNTQQKQRELVNTLRHSIRRFLVDNYDKNPIVLPVFIEL